MAPCKMPLILHIGCHIKYSTYPHMPFPCRGYEEPGPPLCPAGRGWSNAAGCAAAAGVARAAEERALSCGNIS